MLYSKQWRQLSNWSSRAPLWIILSMTPILPVLAVLAAICYLPRLCAVGLGVFASTYAILLWMGAPLFLLGGQLATAVVEFYLITTAAVCIALLESAVRRLLSKKHEGLKNFNPESDDAPAR